MWSNKLQLRVGCCQFIESCLQTADSVKVEWNQPQLCTFSLKTKEKLRSHINVLLWYYHCLLLLLFLMSTTQLTRQHRAKGKCWKKPDSWLVRASHSAQSTASSWLVPATHLVQIKALVPLKLSSTTQSRKDFWFLFQRPESKWTFSLIICQKLTLKSVTVTVTGFLSPLHFFGKCITFLPLAYWNKRWFKSKRDVVNPSEDAKKRNKNMKVKRKRVKREGVVMFVAWLCQQQQADATHGRRHGTEQHNHSQHRVLDTSLNVYFS